MTLGLITIAITNPGAESVSAAFLGGVIGKSPLTLLTVFRSPLVQWATDVLREQTVQLCNVPTPISTMPILLRTSWLANAHNYPNDQGQVIAEFLDADSGRLGAMVASSSTSAPAGGSG